MTKNKFFHSLFIITMITFFIGCKEEKKQPVPEENPKQVEQSKTQTTISNTTLFNVDLSSKLKEKALRLTKLKHAYTLKEFGYSEYIRTTLLGTLERLLSADFLNFEDLDKDDLVEVKNNLSQSYRAFVKGTKPMTPNGNTYPRAHIEEFIYADNASANAAYAKLNELKKNKRLWFHLSKSPSALFIEGNKLYFIITGGQYMMGMEKEIENSIKN